MCTPTQTPTYTQILYVYMYIYVCICLLDRTKRLDATMCSAGTLTAIAMVFGIIFVVLVALPSTCGPAADASAGEQRFVVTTCLPLCACEYTYTYVCIYACVYICIYKYINTYINKSIHSLLLAVPILRSQSAHSVSRQQFFRLMVGGFSAVGVLLRWCKHT